MAWTTPKTDWDSGDPVGMVTMNAIGENLAALKDPPSDDHFANEVADYTTTSTSFVDVDGTDWSFTITTNGGDVMVGFVGYAIASGNVGFFDVTLDGVRIGGDDGIAPFYTHLGTTAFVILKSGVSAGAHTFKLQWKMLSGGTGTLYAGAGTSTADTHPQFWVREVS